MRPIRSKTVLAAWALSTQLLCISLTTAHGFSTVERTIHSYKWGDRTYTCLAIDGGVVPLLVPPTGGAKVTGGNAATISWPADGTIAVIRPASGREAGLADLMGKPEAAEAWRKAIASTLRGSGYTYKIGDYQPDVLDVNHWRIGAITMDYAQAGRKSSSLLMIWRCMDGSTLAVTMQADADTFQAHYRELSSIIGASLLMKP